MPRDGEIQYKPLPLFSPARQLSQHMLPDICLRMPCLAQSLGNFKLRIKRALTALPAQSTLLIHARHYSELH